jgi:hypothetical protein
MARTFRTVSIERPATWIAFCGGPSPVIFRSTSRQKVDFVVNLRTARALGLAISPDFLSGANEVIE